METEKTSGKQNIMMTLALIGLPVMLIIGIFIGLQLGSSPNQEVAVEQPTDRYDIPIMEDDPVLGPDDAPVTIIEFSDYECPYCQRYHNETFKMIMETYEGQVRYVYKDLPLTSIHPNAAPAAIAAQCAQEQNAFWAYHDLLFSGQMSLGADTFMAFAAQLGLDEEAFETCINSGDYDKIVMADTNILTELKIPLSTPTLFVNGRYVAGALPFSQFAQIIDAEINAVEQ